MALQIERASQCKRDYKRIKRQGEDLNKLLMIIRQWAAEEPLDQRHLDHGLSGNWRGYRECHIDGEILRLSRTGSHSELFG